MVVEMNSAQLTIEMALLPYGEKAAASPAFVAEGAAEGLLPGRKISAILRPPSRRPTQ